MTRQPDPARLKMYRYDQIRHLHVEPTTRCNAACPMCARNALGRDAPGLSLTELSAADVRRIFPEAFLEQLTGLDLCGAYGDPAVARELVEIVTYVRTLNSDCKIVVFSNGGARTPRWWASLAGALHRPARVVFGIDGLADTNDVYRRGVPFAKVIENATAFIKAGGEAQWDFLVFRHNENQVEAAAKMSRELGFREFAPKKTSRFLRSAYDYVPEVAKKQASRTFPIHSRSGEIIGQLEPPTNREFVNQTAARHSDLLARYGTLEALFSSTPIACRVKAGKSVFVGAQGYTFPCCWTYAQAMAPVIYEFPSGVDLQMLELVQAHGGFGQANALAVGLRAAVESRLFAAIEASWGRHSVSEGRLKVCARVCGVDFPAFEDQFKSREHIPGTG